MKIEPIGGEVFYGRPDSGRKVEDSRTKGKGLRRNPSTKALEEDGKRPKIDKYLFFPHDNNLDQTAKNE